MVFSNANFCDIFDCTTTSSVLPTFPRTPIIPLEIAIACLSSRAKWSAPLSLECIRRSIPSNISCERERHSFETLEDEENKDMRKDECWLFVPFSVLTIPPPWPSSPLIVLRTSLSGSISRSGRRDGKIERRWIEEVLAKEGGLFCLWRLCFCRVRSRYARNRTKVQWY